MTHNNNYIRKRPWDKPMDYEIRIQKAVANNKYNNNRNLYHHEQEPIQTPDHPLKQNQKGKYKIPIPQFSVLMDTVDDDHHDTAPAAMNHDTHPIPKETIPYVMIDGIPFYSDRFYLNKPEDTIPTTFQSTSYTHHQQQQQQQKYSTVPPPLFDRKRLIENLDIQAMIIATYTWDSQTISNILTPTRTTSTSVLAEDDPSIADNDNNNNNKDINNSCKRKHIPCLILHGSDIPTTVGSTSHTIQKRRSIYYDDSKHNDFMYPKVYQQPSFSCPAYDTDDDNDEKEKKKDDTNKRMEDSTNDRNTDTTTTTTTTTKLDQLYNQHNHLYFTRILPTWIPPPPSSSSSPQPLHNTTTNTPYTNHTPTTTTTTTTTTSRQYCHGVHHPKFMLLFETHGYLTVVVTTANITPGTSIDASWIQRFPPSIVSKNQETEEEDTWDFGPILFDMLEKQSLAAKEGDMLPMEFLQKYYHMTDNKSITSWKDICTWFQFSQAQVQLVSTVPGTYSIHDSRTCIWKEKKKTKDQKKKKKKGQDIQKRILYGPQRIAEILSQIQETKKIIMMEEETWTSLEYKERKTSISKPWLPLHVLSNKDRLIIQSTSWGSSPWSGYHMVQLARMYFGWELSSSSSSQSDIMMNSYSTCYTKDSTRGTMPSSLYDAQDLLEQVDILWPTQEHMNQILGERLSKNDHSMEGTLEGGTDAILGFFTTQTFNQTDVACISRMAMYEPNHQHFFPYILPPHLKTMSRILKRRPLKTRTVLDDTEVDSFAWILLTSACFSRGAQGFSKVHRNSSSLSLDVNRMDIDKDTMSFSNFELGVLFCSRMEGNPSTDRLYQSIPNTFVAATVDGVVQDWKSSSSDKESSPRIIPLPIPYHTRPTMYQQSQKSQQEVDEEEDSSDAYFATRPYFHWIVDRTVGVGNMKLVP